MLPLAVFAAGLVAPPVSPTGVQNRVWRWRGFDVRYQALGEDNDGPAVVLVHGLCAAALRKTRPDCS